MLPRGRGWRGRGRARGAIKVDQRVRPALADPGVDQRDCLFGDVDAIGGQKHGAVVHQDAGPPAPQHLDQDQEGDLEESLLRGLGLLLKRAALGLLRAADAVDAGVEFLGYGAEGFGRHGGTALGQRQFLFGQARLDLAVFS